MLQILCAHPHRYHSILGYRDTSGLLAYDDAHGIRLLAHAECRPMAQTEILRDIHVMTYRKDTPH